MRRHLREVALVTAAAMAVSSCRTTLSTQAGPGALESGHWTMVSKEPPTYYPKGLPAGDTTGARDGSWVSAGDAAGTRFFIPAQGAGGLSRRQLSAEALATVSPSKREELAKDLERENVRDIMMAPVYVVVCGILVALVLKARYDEGLHF